MFHADKEVGMAYWSEFEPIEGFGNKRYLVVGKATNEKPVREPFKPYPHIEVVYKILDINNAVLKPEHAEVPYMYLYQKIYSPYTKPTENRWISETEIRQSFLLEWAVKLLS